MPIPATKFQPLKPQFDPRQELHTPFREGNQSDEGKGVNNWDGDVWPLTQKKTQRARRALKNLQSGIK